MSDVELRRAGAWVRARCARTPDVGVVLGSGLGGFAERITRAISLRYADIPHMPVPRVKGHGGDLVLGEVAGAAGATVACLQGRSHLYEGHSVAKIVFGARLLAHLGCEVVLITNAAGGIAEQLAVGDLMLIEDHLNLTGQNPLVGADISDERRFVDLTRAYDPELLDLAEQAASSSGLKVMRGVYAGMLGPSYETPAEIRMLSTLGASAVGMSTVHEVIALRQLGVRVGGLSSITNLAAGLAEEPLSHGEVSRVGQSVKKHLSDLLTGWIARIEASRSEKPGDFGPSS